MALEELQNLFVKKCNLSIDFLLYNVQDFYQFVAYYGQNYFDIKVHIGCCLVYKKWEKKQVKESDETSTPTFG